MFFFCIYFSAIFSCDFFLNFRSKNRNFSTRWQKWCLDPFSGIFLYRKSLFRGLLMWTSLYFPDNELFFFLLLFPPLFFMQKKKNYILGHFFNLLDLGPRIKNNFQKDAETIFNTFLWIYFFYRKVFFLNLISG